MLLTCSTDFQQVIFEEGQIAVPIQMTVLADDLPEVSESVAIQLQNPQTIEER